MDSNYLSDALKRKYERDAQNHNEDAKSYTEKLNEAWWREFAGQINSHPYGKQALKDILKRKHMDETQKNVLKKNRYLVIITFGSPTTSVDNTPVYSPDEKVTFTVYEFTQEMAIATACVRFGRLFKTPQLRGISCLLSEGEKRFVNTSAQKVSR